MSDVVTVPAAALARWRRQAKELRKKDVMPHHAALDAVARLTGVFRDWHHVVLEAKATEPTEQAFKAGLVIGMDQKDAYDARARRADLLEFLEDDRMLGFVSGEFAKRRPKPWNEEDEWDMEFLRELVYFRWKGALPDTLDQAEKLTRKYFFFLPEYVRLKGELLLDPFSDEDGNE